MRVLIIGGVTYDTIIQLDSLPQPLPQTIFSKASYQAVGGTGAGKALNLAKLGFDVTLHGFIGDDDDGMLIRHEMAKNDVRFIYDIDPKGTEQHTNLMDKNGNRISIYTNSATFDPDFAPDDLMPEIQKCDVVVLNIINYCRYLIPFIKASRKEIWCDLHDYDGHNPYHQDFVQAADIVTFSSDKMADYKDFMQDCIWNGKKLAVCTHGKNGSTALSTDGQWIDTPALNYPLVDSNGAGDAFFAGLLYGMQAQSSVGRSLCYASVVGGLSVESKQLANENLSEQLLLAEYHKHYAE